MEDLRTCKLKSQHRLTDGERSDCTKGQNIASPFRPCRSLWQKCDEKGVARYLATEEVLVELFGKDTSLIELGVKKTPIEIGSPFRPFS